MHFKWRAHLVRLEAIGAVSLPVEVPLQARLLLTRLSYALYRLRVRSLFLSQRTPDSVSLSHSLVDFFADFNFLLISIGAESFDLLIALRLCVIYLGIIRLIIWDFGSN